MSIVYWCLHIWGDSIQAACSGNGQANFDKEFETMIDNGRETLHSPKSLAHRSYLHRELSFTGARAHVSETQKVEGLCPFSLLFGLEQRLWAKLDKFGFLRRQFQSESR